MKDGDNNATQSRDIAPSAEFVHKRNNHMNPKLKEAASQKLYGKQHLIYHNLFNNFFIFIWINLLSQSNIFFI